MNDGNRRKGVTGTLVHGRYGKVNGRLRDRDTVASCGVGAFGHRHRPRRVQGPRKSPRTRQYGE